MDDLRERVERIANGLSEKRKRKLADLSWAISRDRLWMREKGLLTNNEYTPLGLAVRAYIMENGNG